MSKRQLPSKPDRLMPLLDEWYLWVGSIYLYIVGPGSTAMRRCSRRNMNPGTPEEIALAERALAILNEHHRENVADGEPEILAAMLACGYEEEE